MKIPVHRLLSPGLFLGVIAVGQAANTFPSSGNVGIGTASPSTTLEVNGTATVGYLAVNPQDSGSEGGEIKLKGAGSNGDVYIDNYGGDLRLFPAAGKNLQLFGKSAQNTYTVDTGVTDDLRILSSDNRGYDGAIITLGGSWGPTGYIKTAAYDGTAGAVIIGNRRGSSDTVMQPGILLDTSGNVGIGTTNPTQKLSVNGTVRAKEVIVDTGWSDYVFDSSYRLAPLSEVEQHIKAQKHLPGIPSAQEVGDHGISVGDMQSKLLAKIEELTLHQIEQEKQIAALKAEVRALKAGQAQ